MTIKSFISNNLVEFSKKSKILEKKEEFYHNEQWRDKRESKSHQIILNAYMRLAVSYARKYKSYGLPLDDLIHEGVLGIMHALEKFDISKDFRLSTYASWWIRASIQDYILDVKEISTKINTGSIIYLTGRTDIHIGKTTTGGEINAETLQSEESKIYVNTGSIADVSATDILELNIRTGGIVNVYSETKRIKESFDNKYNFARD